MTYYEELGIHRDASSSEIRRAYKLAARLLHPDTQLDPQLKDLAECQMKRLRGVVEILVNPRARALYDAGLANGVRPGRPASQARDRAAELLQPLVRHWFWVAVGGMTILMGVWYGLARSPDIPSGLVAAESARAPAETVATPNEQSLAKRLSVVRNTVVTQSEASPSAATPIEEQVPEEAPREKQTARPESEPANAERGGDSPFSGKWLYVEDRRGGDRAGTYPAKSIEFQLQYQSGTLAGGYRALYGVADKAIAPEVVFRVSGQSPAGNWGKLHWESNAGAKGELELTLRSPGELHVKWWTTQFGEHDTLTSGIAVLSRMETP